MRENLESLDTVYLYGALRDIEDEDYFGTMFGQFWKHFGSLWDHLRKTLEPSWKHFWTILVLIWDDFGTIFGSL